MPYNRKAIAPWSTEREQGIESATVDSNIETPQYLQPVVNTGNIDLNGNWIGVRTSDKLFTIDSAHEGVPNGAVVLSPQKSDADFIDMTGYQSLFIALQVSNAGNYTLEAVMGPDTNTFANLTPLDPNSVLQLAYAQSPTGLADAFKAVNTALTVDVWEIIDIQERLSDQKNLQFRITNNSGDASNINFAYMRLI